MNKSIFKGHLINDSESKLLYESSGSLANFHEKNPFDKKIKTLSKYGISDWEQIYSLVKNDNIRNLLKETLNFDSDDEIENLQTICEKAISKNQLKALENIEISDCPLGARKPIDISELHEKVVPNKYEDILSVLEVDRKINEINAFDKIPYFTFANSISFIHELSSIKAQGKRGTCTAFAVSAANEYSIYKRTNLYHDLSEQHLFYETKVLENDVECGSWIRNAMQTISDKGQCLENIWAYNPNEPCVKQNGKPSNADINATLHKNTFLEINKNKIQVLKQVLSTGRLVVFSIPVFASWYNSQETKRTGRITLPLPGEPEIEGHSMVLVGYQDENSSPGGGYFMIRNSWGVDWGKDNFYGAGYGVIPYSYIEEYNWEAFSF